jgi:hypothetical protein
VLVLAVLAAGAAHAEGAAAGAAAPTWPLDLPPVLTSSFGEYRSNHVHAGIDLGTGGRTGVPCRATGDGSVVRMRMSPFGYGKALYVQLDGGPLAVYAHLSRFAAPMAARARAEQEGRRRYSFDITLPPGELRVRRGQVIAWSGQTGVGVPHLHFELRDGDVARNPQTAGYAVRDTMRPVIAEVVAMPMDVRSHVGGALQARPLRAGARAVPIAGRIGLGVRAWDHATSREHRQGPYRYELRVDGKTLFRLVNERFDYATNHHAVLEYDQERLLEHDERVQLLFLRDGNRLAGRAAPGIEGGLLVAAAGGDDAAPGTLGAGEHTVEVLVADVAGRTTTRSLRVVVGGGGSGGGEGNEERAEALEKAAILESVRSYRGSGGEAPPELHWRARWVELEFSLGADAAPGEKYWIAAPEHHGAVFDASPLDARRWRAVLPLQMVGEKLEITAGVRSTPIHLPARFVRRGGPRPTSASCIRPSPSTSRPERCSRTWPCVPRRSIRRRSIWDPNWSRPARVSPSSRARRRSTPRSASRSGPPRSTRRTRGSSG